MTEVGLISWTRCDDALVVVTRDIKPLRLQLVGELDVANASDAYALLSFCMRDSGSAALDLQRLAFIDLAGARMLGRLADLLDGDGLVLVNVSPLTQRLLILTSEASRAALGVHDAAASLVPAPVPLVG